MDRKQQRWWTGALTLVMVLAAWGWLPARVVGADGLFDTAAMNIALFLKNYDEDKIVVQFHGPPTYKGSANLAFTQTLTEKLAARKITVAEKAKFGVEGKMTLVLPRKGERSSPRLAVKLTIVDDSGEQFVNYDLGTVLSNEADVLAFSGGTSDLSGKRKREDRDDALTASFRNGKVEVTAKSEARASRGSPYALALLVEGSPRPITSKDGLGFVEVDLNKEYTLRLTNDSARQAAVRVLVDGLSVFHFSDIRAKEEWRKSEPQYRYFIIPPRGQVEVKGYHKTNKLSKGFKVVPFEESEAAKLGRTTDIGMVTVLFYSCWGKDEKPPPDEPSIPSSGGVVTVVGVTKSVKDTSGKQHDFVEWHTRTSLQVGTKQGTDQATDFKSAERTIGSVRSAVTLRYQRK